MKKQSLTQEALTEVLIDQVGQLNDQLKESQAIFVEKNELLKRLERLYQKPITVDTANMEDAHQNIRATLQEGLCVPRWLGYTGLAVSFVLAISLATNVQYYRRTKHQQAYIEESHAHIVELREELKGKSKKAR